MIAARRLTRCLHRYPGLTVGLVSFFVALATVAGIAWRSAVAAERPSISLLGSGDGLSVLIVDGPARFLLVAGDDATEFHNALNASLAFGRGRIDVLVLTGDRRSVTFLDRVRAGVDARLTESLATGDANAELGLPSSSRVSRARRYRLSETTSITVEVRDASTSGDGAAPWRAIVQHRATRVVVLADAAAAGSFPDISASAVVIAGELTRDSQRIADSPLLAASARAIEGRDLRALAGAPGSNIQWILRVHPGDAIQFHFVAGGLKAPSALQPVERPTPTP